MTKGTIVPHNASELVFSGRTLLEADQRRFDWPGVRLLFRVRNTSSCSIFLNETQTNRYAVFLGSSTHSPTGNYVLHRTFTASNDKGGKYTIFTGLRRLTHAVMLVKVTEACGSNTGCDWGVFGTAGFGGLEVDAGAQLVPAILPWRSGRRLLFLGDSITVGWGLLGNATSSATQCNNDEDHSEAWGAQLSRMLRAEFHSVAWSGIGLLRGDPTPSGGTPLNRSILQLMTQTLANEPSAPMWNSSQWPASAVVIHIISIRYHNMCRFV